MAKALHIGFVIVWFNTPEKEKRSLRKEIESLDLSEYSVHEIDNSEDNVGFAAAANRGIKEALEKGSDVICLVNPDIEIKDQRSKIPTSPEGSEGRGKTKGKNQNIFKDMLFDITGGVMEQGGVKYFGGEIDKRRMSGGLRILSSRSTHPGSIRKQSNEGILHQVRDDSLEVRDDSVGVRDDGQIDFVSGSLMCIKRHVFEKIGYLDESYFMYYEDVEFCKRARNAGFSIGIDPSIEYIHYDSSETHPRKRFWLAKNRLKFALDYGGSKQLLWELIYLPKTLPELCISFVKSSPFSQNMLSLNISSVLTKLLSFVLFFTLIRVLAPAEYGVWVLAWAHSSILNPIIDFGTTTYGLTHYDHDGRGIGYILQLRTFLSLVVLMATIGLAFLLGYSSSTLPLVLIISLTTITNSVSGSFLIWNSVRGRARVSALYGFLFELLLSTTLIIGVVGFRDIWVIGGIAVVQNLGYAGFLLHKMWREGNIHFFGWIQKDFSKTWRSWKPILNHSLVFALIAFFAGLYYRIDVFLLNKLKGAGELAVYSAGYKFFDASLLLAASYNITAAPVLARLAHLEPVLFTKKIKKDVAFLSVVGTFAVLGCWFCAPLLKYAGLVGMFGPSIKLLQIVIVALPFMLISSVFLNVLYVLKKMWWAVFVFMGMVVWNGALNYVLIPQYGAFASAYITVTTELVNVVVLGVMMLYALKNHSTKLRIATGVAVDGGALCSPHNERFGTYSVSAGIIQSLQNTPQEYSLRIYGFNDLLQELVEKKYAHILQPSFGWQKWRVPLEQHLHPTDWFIALNQAIPSYVAGKVISLSHGLSFMKFPDLYPDSYKKMKGQVEEMVRRSEVILVSSKRVKKEFDELFPDHGRIEVVMFGTRSSVIASDSAAISQNRLLRHFVSRNDKLDDDYHYILVVGMDHPIKNHAEMIRIVEKVRETSTYSLILVGAGERQSTDPKWLTRIPHASGEDLAHLYSNAECLLTTSLYESFNLPVIESLSTGTPVVGYSSAIIPELEKYVRVVESVDEAVKAILKKDFVKVPRREELEKEFSWTHFVQKLAVIASASAAIS